MAILVFDGRYDAYFWVLCTEKYFKVKGTPEKEKMILAAMAMSGCALKWWCWWSPLHPGVSWDTFTSAFLWRFKPEYHDILPIFDEEEEPDPESPPLMELDGSSQESLNDTLKAWDEFLLSTEHIEVPTVHATNLMVEAMHLKSNFNGEITKIPEATTKIMIATTESFASTNFVVDQGEFLPSIELIAPHAVTNEDSVQSDEPPCDVIDDGTVRNHGLSLNCEFHFALNFARIVKNHARIREPKFKLRWDDLLAEHKLVPWLGYSKVEVDIAEIPHDSRLVPPSTLFGGCSIEKYVTVIVVGVSNVVQGLLGFLGSDEVEIQEKNTKAVSGVLDFNSYKGVLDVTSVITPWIPVLNCGNVLGKVTTARCLMKFQEKLDSAWAVPSHACVTALLHNCRVLRNLVGVEEIKRFMVEKDVVSIFIRIVKSKEEAMQVHSLRFIQNIAYGEELVTPMVITKSGIYAWLSVFYPKCSYSSKTREIATRVMVSLCFSSSANEIDWYGFVNQLLHYVRKGVGFIHGVLHTDNMNILGFQVAYGPFGFLGPFDPSFTPNTTHFQRKKYCVTHLISVHVVAVPIRGLKAHQTIPRIEIIVFGHMVSIYVLHFAKIALNFVHSYLSGASLYVKDLIKGAIKMIGYILTTAYAACYIPQFLLVDCNNGTVTSPLDYVAILGDGTMACDFKSDFSNSSSGLVFGSYITWLIDSDGSKSITINISWDTSIDKELQVGAGLGDTAVLQLLIVAAEFEFACQDAHGFSAAMHLTVKGQVKSFWLLVYAAVDVKWDPGGDGYVVHVKGSLQFKQWDPGTCPLIHWEGPLDLEATWKEVTITQMHCPNFNLEDKVDFNGGGNVMILVEKCQVSKWVIS